MELEVIGLSCRTGVVPSWGQVKLALMVVQTVTYLPVQCKSIMAVSPSPRFLTWMPSSVS